MTDRILDSSTLRSLLADVMKKAPAQRVVSDLTMQVRFTWPVKLVEGVRFVNVNFASPLLGGLLSRPVFRGCQFDNVKWGGMNAVKVTFQNCEFTKTDFGVESIGYFIKCSFLNNRFSNCRMVSVHYKECQIAHCELTKQTIEDSSFGDSDLESVIIQGRCKHFGFNSCRLQQVDLTGAVLIDTSFAYGQYKDCRFPTRPDNFVVPGPLLKQAEEHVKNEFSTSIYETYCSYSKWLSQLPLVCIDPEVFDELPKDQRTAVMKLLYKLAGSGPPHCEPV